MDDWRLEMIANAVKAASGVAMAVSMAGLCSINPESGCEIAQMIVVYGTLLAALAASSALFFKASKSIENEKKYRSSVVQRRVNRVL